MTVNPDRTTVRYFNGTDVFMTRDAPKPALSMVMILVTLLIYLAFCHFGEMDSSTARNLCREIVLLGPSSISFCMVS